MTIHKNRTKKEKAFDTLSVQARLHIKLEDATTDHEKFKHCVNYATEIAQKKSLTKVDETTDINLKIIMQLIKSYLNSGVHPDSLDDNNHPAIFDAITYPELVKLLLENGANPNFQDKLQHTPLHHVAMIFHSFYEENLFITAEILSAAGADLNLKNSNGKKAIELIKDTLLVDKDKIGEIENRFKHITDFPRQINEIPIQPTEESPYSYLQLTETDNKKIVQYREGKYNELINSASMYLTRHSFLYVSDIPLTEDKKDSALTHTSIDSFKSHSL
jgi:ankyrin repeat protein